MSTWLLGVAMVLATFRLTRLVVKDDFPPVKWTRDKVRLRGAKLLGYAADGEAVYEYRWWGELVTCHWCSSAYVAAGVVGLTDVVTSVPLPVLAWLAVWGTAAVLADRLG